MPQLKRNPGLLVFYFLSIPFLANAQETESDSCKLETKETIQHVSCSGGDDGSIEIAFEQIENPTFLWSNDQNSQNIYNLIAGTYSLTISDQNCNVTRNFLVEEPENNLSIKLLDKVDVMCAGFTDGSAEIEAQGGTAPYEYRMQGDDTFTSDGIFSNLSSGNYIFEARDRMHCLTSLSIDIEESVSDQIDLGTDLTIHSGETIEIDAGPGYQEYIWSSGESGQVLEFDRESTQDVREELSVEALDENGCSTASNVITITILAATENEEEPEIMEEE